MTDWDALLQAEGMPSEPHARRLRQPLAKRIPGRDPQPLREIPHSRDYSPRGPLDTEIEVMMHGGDGDSKEYLEADLDLLRQFLVSAVDDDRTEAVLDLLYAGYRPGEIAAELRCTVWAVSDITRKVREATHEYYGTNDRPDTREGNEKGAPAGVQGGEDLCGWPDEGAAELQ